MTATILDRSSISERKAARRARPALSKALRKYAITPFLLCTNLNSGAPLGLHSTRPPRENELVAVRKNGSLCLATYTGQPCVGIVMSQLELIVSVIATCGPEGLRLLTRKTRKKTKRPLTRTRQRPGQPTTQSVDSRKGAKRKRP